MINSSTQKGFSILETLLTTAVVVGVLLVVFNLFEDYAEKTLVRSTAKYLDDISLAVEEIVNDETYFNILYTLADAETNDVLELSINNLINGFGVVPNNIPASTILNSNVRQETPLKTGVEIMVRVADNPAITTDANALEIIIITDERVLVSRARSVASELGAYGGHYIDAADNIRNSFRSWEVDPAVLNDSTWAGLAATNPPSQANGAYIVHYKHKSYEDIAGDYLYRDLVVGSPELNQMNTDLNLGENNIVGVDNLEIDNDLTLGANAIVNGSVNISNATFTESNFTAENQMTTGNALIRGNGSGVRGNFSVENSLSITNFSANGSVSANNATFSNGISTTGEVRSNGRLEFEQGFQANSVSVGNLRGRSGTTFDVNVGGDLKAADLTTNRLAVGGSGNIGAIDTQVSGNLGVTGDINVPSVGFGTLNVTTFGACDRGC